MSSKEEYTILGAGLAGLSSAYHIGHEKCVLFEKNTYPGGHVHSYKYDGFTWDEGPHVSFTKHKYVKDLFSKSVNGQFLEHPVQTTNYYKGSWIPHPAQSNLYAIPIELREYVLKDFLQSRQTTNSEPGNYEQWLITAFGNTFYKHFPLLYTKKYWTRHPCELTTDWVGKRVFYPNLEEVKKGCHGPLERQTHYISRIRYPKEGGYFSFAKALVSSANVHYDKEIVGISLENKLIHFKDGTTHYYTRLINTLPMPAFIEMSDAPKHIKDAAKLLECTKLLLVNVIANHPATRKENWIYVYDESKLSTRLYCTELLSPENGVPGKTGIQVEIYFSSSKPQNESRDAIVNKVLKELTEMKLIKECAAVESVHTRWVPFANVIFDHNRKKNLDRVLNWLEQYGLIREEDDLYPTTNWEAKAGEQIQFGDIILAGRFGQWKYYWSDGCVLRGRFIGF